MKYSYDTIDRMVKKTAGNAEIRYTYSDTGLSFVECLHYSKEYANGEKILYR